MSAFAASVRWTRSVIPVGLREYHRKRDFRKTPEPRGRRTRGHRQLALVVQKHDASHLHYDFRLELDGVFKSWAVPKGPDLDPSQKRLAMQVEDHPLEYGDFEGTIPEGQYGGGTVMLWDRGTWEPIGDAHEGLRDGALKFVVHGEKLKGRWMLVRRGGRKSGLDERHWFLFKERDEFARTGTHITETEPRSVATGRDLDEIATQSDRVWGPAGETPQNAHKKKTASSRAATKREVRGSKRAASVGAPSPGQSKRASRAGAKKKPRLSRSKLTKLLAHPAAKPAKLPTSQAVEPTDVVRDEPISTSEVRALQNQNSSQRRRNSREKTEVAARADARHKARASADADVVAGVRLSHPDKVLYPEEGITKLDLANYYAQVAEWMLPHVMNRPLALVRCPEGAGKPCFFQRHPGPGAFKQLRQVDVSAGATPEYHLVIDDEAGLIALVQMGVLEIHAWGSQAKRIENPDRLIFDLDPDPSVEWPEVVRAAREVRQVLEELGLTSFLKTTGGKGLHIVVPVQPRLDWDEAKAFCQAVADFVVRAAPDRYIASMSKAARKGKVFVDYLRNARGATAIAAYSTRSRPGATASVPIAWDELSFRLRSDQFTIAKVPARLAKLKKDPWTEMATTKQSITKAMRKRLE